MSNAVRRSTDPLPVERPDPQFSLAVGLYGALVVVPVALVAADIAGVGGPAAMYGVFLVTGFLCTVVVTWAVGSTEGVAVRLGESRVRWALPFVGIVLAVGSFALVHRVGGIAVVGFFFGLFVVMGGFLVSIMARTRYVKALVETVDVEAEWAAGWPEAAENRLKGISGGMMAVGGISLVVSMSDGWGPLFYVGQLLFPLGVLLFNLVKEREYTASPVGIEIRQTEFRRHLPWSAFDGYSRTDDAIVCHRPWRVDLRFALDDLGDPDAVEETIERHLGPRSPAFNPSSA